MTLRPVLACFAAAAVILAAAVSVRTMQLQIPVTDERAAAAPAPATAVPPAPAAPSSIAAGSTAIADPQADPGWLARTAAATGIPARALQAYAGAQLRVAAIDPACGLGWNTLAAIGSIESDHGRHGGAVLGADGYSRPAILGPALDGDGDAAIPDTDHGGWDGDTVWDHAVGPMQFIPQTWTTWGADGNGDGIADPNQIDDASLAAARYLCAAGPLTTAQGWRAAIFSYNHLDSYVDDIAARANQYAADAGHG